MKKRVLSIKAALEGRIEYHEYEENREPRQIKPCILRIGDRAIFVSREGLSFDEEKRDFQRLFLN